MKTKPKTKGRRGLFLARGTHRAMDEDEEQPEGDVPAEETDAATPTLYVYDFIGEDWLGQGVTAKRVVALLEELEGAEALTVRINSPGGDVFEAVAIYNALARWKGRVTVHVDGLAASAASVIALAGDRVLVAESGMFMVHEPWTIAWGPAPEMRRVAATLDKVWTSMLATYESRTGQREAVIRQRVEDAGGEWWMTATEAVEAGFADDVEKHERVVALYGLGAFDQVPAELVGREEPGGEIRGRRGAGADTELADPRVRREPRPPTPTAALERFDCPCGRGEQLEGEACRACGGVMVHPQLRAQQAARRLQVEVLELGG